MYDKRTAGQYIVVAVREESIYIPLEDRREEQKKVEEEQKKVDEEQKKLEKNRRN